MKITIVGPGALGSLFAALLERSKAKHEIWLLDKHPERAKKIASAGVCVEGASNFKQKVNITADAKDIGASELVIILTKSYDTPEALISIKPLLTSSANILTLQNGLGNMQLISEIVGDDRTVGGFTAHGATLLDVGRVKHSGKGETIIGKPNKRIFADLRQISAVLNEAGIVTRISKDIKGVIWSKLIINAGINALASVCRLPNGELLKHEGTREILRQAVFEATRVAKRKRIKLVYDDSLQKVESVCIATKDNICSMLQDVMRREPTEIDFINGAIVRQGKSCGIKTPVNEMLTALVETIESSYKKQVK
ncbi:MAG: 2-dehydropantoate 2-reductase [Candidatus Omnitrophica bacterium]|nr:2-dehydropantoate 2-reductase [Candidatus Omnitrophota bacterium]